MLETGTSSAYIVTVVLGENGKELLEELNKLVGHFLELLDEAVGVDVTVSGTDGIVDKEKVGKLMPRAVVPHESFGVLDSVWPDFHQRAVF